MIQEQQERQELEGVRRLERELESLDRGWGEEEAERLKRERELPSRPCQASFDPMPATVSRPPRDDELYVMQRFARHASHCVACAHPYTVDKTGGTLCPKGHQRAIDVIEYVIAKEGKYHSVIDLEGNKRVEMRYRLIAEQCGNC